MQRLAVIAGGMVSLVLAGTAAAEEPARIDFARDIRPILSDNCFACHGPDEPARKAALRLDLPTEALKPRDGVAAIVPGQPADSALIERVTSTDESLRMPPPETGKSLTPAQIRLLKQWISEGASWSEHWAWSPPRRPVVPAVPPSEPARNEIDAFVLAALRLRKLAPAPEADRITLARRLSFDLTGLPPDPEHVAAFAKDRHPDAVEREVDRLLASPHFGERLALYWLDVVRYADTIGIHSDNHRNVDLYRDYVIRSFNDNLPFNQFVVEQIAGDLLPDPTPWQHIASGYNRLSMTTNEGGAQPKEYMAKYSADRVRNTATAFLGVTLGCAECHDHKFDPFLTKDFYRFAAFFADVQETPVGNQQETPFPTPDEERVHRQLEQQIQQLKTQLASTGSAAEIKAQLDQAERQLNALRQSIRKTLVSVSLPPRVIRVLPRGNWLDETGEVVDPGVPSFLHQASGTSRLSRRDLASWLAADENPLTARVFVNRLWKLCFGRGLVRTLDDFGSQGAAPTHPDLLDWLTTDFIDHGWDVKRTLRLIVTSGTYRQQSGGTPEQRAADPANEWLARQGRFRLDAELIRDTALVISGVLAPQLYGRSVRPWQPPGYWANLNFPQREYQVDTGDNLYRRGLYTYWCRTYPHPSLTAFDAPSREESCVERPKSNTPLQALVLLNDPNYVEAARGLAERLLRAREASSDAGRIEQAYQWALSRPPRSDELAVLSQLLTRHRKDFASDAAACDKLLTVGGRPAPPDLDRTELAAWTSVARVLLNLHETMIRY